MRQIEAFEAYDKVVIVTLILHFLNKVYFREIDLRQQA